MSTSTTSSAIRAEGGLATGASDSIITRVIKGTVSVVVPTTAADTVADIDLTIAGAALGDIVVITPTDTAMEVDLLVTNAWVASANTVTVRIFNKDGANALTGSTQSWNYILIRS